MAYLEYFSHARLALNSEIQYHQDLLPHIAKFPPQDFENRLAVIAAYCGIIVDGDYAEKDVDELCWILREKLYIKRTIEVMHVNETRNDN